MRVWVMISGHIQDNISESLRPNSSLYKLYIKGHGGENRPSWLDVNISVRTLESLQLNDARWTKFPSLGEVWLVDEHGVEYKSRTLGQGFTNLKRLELFKIPKLRKWVGNGPSELFSYSKVITILGFPFSKDCLELMEFPFA